MSRFDISQASQFESRDGGITKGGLVRNGFSEVDGAGERWANMRPSLATSAPAAFTGSGQGLFKVGASLYGMGFEGTGTEGTAGSWQIQMGFFPFTLDAGSSGLTFGYSPSDIPGGALTPSVWKGYTVADLFVSGGTQVLLGFTTGAVPSNAFTKLRINGFDFNMSDGSYSGNSWSWSGAPITGTGVYSGGYI